MTKRKSFFYSSESQREINQKIKEAAAIVVKQYSGDTSEIVHRFIQLFYTNPSSEYFSQISSQQLATMLGHVWKFFSHKKTPTKVEIKHINFPNKSRKLYINITAPNMAFIVDSLLGLFDRLNIKHCNLFHPLFEVNRNNEGHVTHLKKPVLENGDHNLESLIHCEINYYIPDKLISELSSEIIIMLHEIKLANQDWLNMRYQCNTVIQALNERAVPSEQSAIEFLKWIENGHYTFLGYAFYDLDDQQTDHPFKRSTLIPSLGILKDKDRYKLSHLFKGISIDQRTYDYIFTKTPILINKTSQVSRVHRSVSMDSIGIRCFDVNGKVIGMHIFIGLFTSVAYDSSARDIPMLREKIDQILYEAGFDKQWHDGKALSHILDSLPRDELFQAKVSELKEMGLAILRLQERTKVALFVRNDIFNRFLSCLVFIPRDRFDSQLCLKLGKILADEFEGEIGLYKAQFGSLPLARVHYTVTIPYSHHRPYNLKKVESILIEASKTWLDLFQTTLEKTHSEVSMQSIYARYNGAFGRSYQDRFSPSEALADIQQIEEILSITDISVRLYNLYSNKNRLKLKLYNQRTSITLSDALPLFENLGFRVISEISFQIKLQDQPHDVWIHDFELEIKSGEPFDIQLNGALVATAFLGVYKGHIENDSFNKLIGQISLSGREVMIFRAYAKYILQLQLPFSKIYIAQALEKNPQVTKLLWSYFKLRFDPRHKQFKNFDNQPLLKALDQIENIDEDRILRLFYSLISATLRTNFYQTDANQKFKNHVSFKFSSHLINELPLPRPLYEIFVYSPRVEAIHLRGGKVARGGIRWSDRLEDFRSEVLSLMKAQMVKNSIIVPVGSKGGFIIKSSTEGLSRDALQQEAIACYQIMIAGLLDLTDNNIRGKFRHPNNTVCYDDYDPYLVVAADKGTSSFSDIANRVSLEYDYWLGDAFASGGSAGYDHKKMGITARGAWESVKRHFRELNKDIQKEPFTVVGIGDMSGDVFGNGMLLSKKIQLIAAFNHQHIFIDPNPDTIISFKERKRLFKLARSSWSDYNSEILSVGGKIYDRTAKNIVLTPQIQALLHLDESTIKPNELIKAIMTASFDLLWLGGIGTFIKSRSESHADASDRTNDGIRVNANQLQCKVIGEGANLGITQQGRIEFCRLRQGKLNTDFIDNSAGVSCSDHEVNIKILFQYIQSSHSISRAQRNQLLEKMTTHVTELVLSDNYLQPQIISMLDLQGSKKLDQQIQLIRSLEKEGLMLRHLEGIPDDNGLEEYQKTNLSLSRPEHAVLLSYGKISFYDKLLKIAILDHPYFNKILIGYFPHDLQLCYQEEIKSHPLKKEIIATVVVNKILNRMGSSFIHECIEIASVTIEQIVHAYFVIVEIFKLDTLWKDIESLDNKIQAQDQLTAFVDIYKILKRTLLWILRYYPLSHTIEETIVKLRRGIDSFMEIGNKLIANQDSIAFDLQTKKYNAMHFPFVLSERLALLNTTSLAPDIVLISDKSKINIAQVADLYFHIGHFFHFNSLRQALDRPNLTATSWERLQANGLMEDLYTYQSQLVLTVLNYYHAQNYNKPIKMEKILRQWMSLKTAHLHHLVYVADDLKKSQALDLTKISVYARELKLISMF